MAFPTAYRASNGREKSRRTVTGDTALAPTDNGGQIIVNSASAVEITVPPLLVIGFHCQVIRYGTGTVEFVEASTTIESPSGFYAIDKRYGKVEIVSPLPDVFILSGELFYDREAPTAPVLDPVTIDSDTEITMVWSAATDNVGVTNYQTRIDGGAWVDRGNILTYQYTGLTGSTSYDFEVRANDASENFSVPSNLESGTTDAPVNHIVVEYDAELEAYANNDSMGQLTDQSGNAYHAVQATGSLQFQYKTDDGDYYNCVSAGTGQNKNYVVPNYTADIADRAQMFAVVKCNVVSSKLWRLLGEGDQAAAYTETFSNNVYEPFGSETRKDNKDPAPNFDTGWVVYRVVSRDNFYEMSVNGVVFFTTTTNTFSKDTVNPFEVGQSAGSGCDYRLKYLAILDDNSTDLTSALMTRFGIT
jgi:chitodextrinase